MYKNTCINFLRTGRADMEKEEKSVVEDDVDQEILEAVSPGRRELKILNIKLKVVGEDLSVLQDFKQELELSFSCQGPACKVCFSEGLTRVFDVTVKDVASVYQGGSTVVFLRVSQGSAVVTTRSQNDSSQLLNHIDSHVASGERKMSKQSVFTLRTEEASSKQYFQFYGYLSQQQNMMQDYVRTSTYQSAMLQNLQDFKDKVVMDVGAGTGILSFFAVQAGAKKVYAVEASSMAVHCARLVSANRLSDKITVIAGKVEEVDIPEKIDMIISEPMGYMLYNERMIESYLHAKKWLKPEGKMFPSKGLLYMAPFSDEALYMEQYNKSTFWTQTSFHGVNLTVLAANALEEYFKQPVLDTYDVRIVMAKPIAHTTDFLTTNEADLHKISIPLSYTLWSTGMMHGLAFWFDVAFCGSQETVWLSTAPTHPLTHWYQIRCLFPRPALVNSGQVVTGNVTLTANQRQSYDIEIEVEVQGTDIRETYSYDLKNPNFRYMAGPTMVPGTQHTNPTESYFDNITNMPSTPSGGSDSVSPQSIVGQAARTDPSNLVNGGGLLVNPPGHIDAMSPYQQIPMATHMVPMSQTFQSTSIGSGSQYVGSSNQVLYAVTSMGGPGMGGGGLMYKYQQLHPVSQVSSGGVYTHTPQNMGNYSYHQSSYGHS